MRRRGNTKKLPTIRTGYMALAAGIALLFSAGNGLPLGAFNGCAAVYSTFGTDTDWTAPTAASVIKKESGYLDTKVKYLGTYRVYANVTETDPTNGHPPSGVDASTITANVQVTGNILTTDAGANSVSLSSTGGPWSVEGTSYTYRSSVLTVNNAFMNGFNGNRTFKITAADNNGTSATTSFTATVDNTAPTGTDIQGQNGGTVAKPDTGDIITYTASEQLDPESILSGWTGASTAVKVVFTNNGTQDTFAIWKSDLSTQLALGSVNTMANVVGSSGAEFAATMSQAAGSSDITVTFGALTSGSTSTEANNTMQWTPSTSAYDGAANAMSGSLVTETGTSDKDF